ncbi:type II secretion system F family protein [Planctomycetota bacterium]
MLNYLFKAKNTDGTPASGSLRATNRDVAITTLRKRGYYLVSVDQQNAITALLHSNIGLGYRATTKEKAIFSHQLAALLKAGMQLTVALKTLSRQTANKHLTSVISELYSDIEQSSSLSEAMAKHPKIFSKVYTAIVKAAEESGSLSETLSLLSKELKAQATINSQIRSAMIYPIFLLVVSVAVIVVLTTFVIPKFIELFVTANQALPLPTKILVNSTEFLKSFWPVFLLITASMAFFCLIALRNQHFKLSVDSALLRLPLIGTLNRKLQLARFARTFGSLLAGGVNIMSAINTTKGITRNTAFAREIDNVESGVLSGVTLAKVMGEQKYFSEITANMVAVGEDTGTLPEMLMEIADMHVQESESAINVMTSLLGPFMIIVLGIIIGFIVLAILMPIFETSTMVG